VTDMAFEIRETAAAERAALRALLEECGLPPMGFADPALRMWAAFAGGELVGMAGLEPHGTTGLVRSVATRPAWRGRGVADALVGAVVGAAAAAGMARLWLLTESAEEYFRRRGFTTVPRAAADPQLAASAEFQSGHCAAAVLMTRPLAAGGVQAVDPTRIKLSVRDHYAQAARGERACCVDPAALGYGPEALGAVPAEVREASLGCGSPVAAAGLRPGERVLDLGSGAGLDLLLAARAVGPAGRVHGVDMTPEMVERARAAAARAGLANVSITLGEIEALPLPDGSVDAVISNCVINLSPDKPRVFREAFRVLAPGGRFVVADMLASAPLPAALAADAEAWSACIAGAVPEAEYVGALRAAGFAEVEVRAEPAGAAVCGEAPTAGAAACAEGPAGGASPRVYSAIIRAVKRS
jgi:arsenite methyltransferase